MRVVPYKKAYAPKLSEIIIRNLLEVNSRDYGQLEMMKLAEDFGVAQLLSLAAQRQVFVALEGAEPVGILTVAPSWGSREGYYHILTVFVQPEFHRRGVGSALIAAGEAYVQQKGGKKITIPSSVTAHAFYHKMGYAYTKKAPDEQGHYIMEKYL